MPLPPALAARLAKRGILKADEIANERVEEVIAEDYDDTLKGGGDADHDDRFHDDDSGELIHESLACPNRSNSYHTCSEYCRNRWGNKKFKADSQMTRKRDRLLKNYPPPEGWLEVGDPETGRYYYWNIETDEVSWLPPQHPRANITLSAERLKELNQSVEKTKVVVTNDSDGDSEDDSTDLDDEEDIDDEAEFEELEKEVLKRKHQSEQDRGPDKRRTVRGRVDDSLDPMDPAAYSEVPRGTWSIGLEQRGSAKTGADVTAAGPLFQQRPYPSPGAVLKMNKGSDKK